MANVKVPSMQELLEAGVHFGHQVRRGNPKMKPYIYGAREGVHIIDLAKSEDMLKAAADAAYSLGKEGKVMLLVGTKKQAKDIIEELGKEAQTPFITSKWVGGLLTNFDEIKKNIKKLTELKEEKEKGTLTRYTKKERLLISRKLDKFEENLGGVASIEKVPDALFIVDAVADATAVKEAQRVGITLIGFSDTNANPNDFDYPVAANDDGIKSIKLVAETVIRAYGEGKKAAGEAMQKESTPSEGGAKETAAKEGEEDSKVVEEAAAIEEEVEKKIVEENSGKAA